MRTAFLGPIGLPEAIVLLVALGVVVILLGGFVTGMVVLVKHLRRPRAVIPEPLPRAAREGKD